MTEQKEQAPEIGLMADIESGAALVEEMRAEPEPEEGSPTEQVEEPAEEEAPEFDLLDEEEEAVKIEGVDDQDAEAAADVDLEDDAEDLEVAAEQGAADEQEPAKKKRPSRTDRLQRTIGRVSKERDDLQEKEYQWAEVANGLKLERDHYQGQNQALIEKLAEYADVDDIRSQQENARLRLQLQERDFEEKMRTRKHQLKQDSNKRLNAERRVDQAMDQGEKLAQEYDVDRDFLLFNWMNNGVDSSMEDMAKTLTKKRVVKRSAAVKKQTKKNQSAPRRTPRGKSARPTPKPKFDNQESWVDSAFEDIERRRKG